MWESESKQDSEDDVCTRNDELTTQGVCVFPKHNITLSLERLEHSNKTNLIEFHTVLIFVRKGRKNLQIMMFHLSLHKPSSIGN